MVIIGELKTNISTNGGGGGGGGREWMAPQKTCAMERKTCHGSLYELTCCPTVLGSRFVQNARRMSHTQNALCPVLMRDCIEINRYSYGKFRLFDNNVMTYFGMSASNVYKIEFN